MSASLQNTIINVRPSRRRLIRFSNGLKPGNTHNTVSPSAIGMTYNDFQHINTMYQQPPPPPPPPPPLPPAPPPLPQKRPNWWYGGKRKTRKTKRRNRK